ncbi:hypothetical protein [Actinomadura sp. J1-007]|uniref:hypothetical protein n=1 Tax=Actinomadura sp. J1-007 TaxID=2661913 RepID=UPI0019D621E0|nr:hypothetical protein [Actinomadura sp. J1-007]
MVAARGAGVGLSLTVVTAAVLLPLLVGAQSLVWWTFRGGSSRLRTCRGVV